MYLLELTVSLMPDPKMSLDAAEFVTLWEIQLHKPRHARLMLLNVLLFVLFICILNNSDNLKTLHDVLHIKNCAHILF